ncbi:hypothetical protein [Pseudomonas sp. PICF6]|jgi:hypothetical protein|uniref:hypothetical protein n=1 Tax=Pseudomonas sp. PICF6 TaxID=2664172 RepID=UPI001367A3E0|nr:hypothetical protein [Pseudomonas sp. PICF6]MXR30178.1 hypothetical protein [Pseudomonas sp. PICF6]
MGINRAESPVSLRTLESRHVDDARSTHLERTGDVSSVDGDNSPELIALKDKLDGLFEPHRTAENHEAINALIHDRAVELKEMGETPETVEALLDKAARMDRVTAPVQGGVASVPFAAASVVLDKAPKVTAHVADNPALTGFVAGAFSGAVDAVGGGLLARATHDTYWLKPPPETLEPVMQQALTSKKEETRVSNAGECALSWQTFSARNAVRLVVAGAMNATVGPKAASAVDTAITSAGSLAAGAGYAHLMNKNDLQAHRAGPAYLLGRTDWKTQYQALKESTPLSPLANGAKRMAKLPLSLLTDVTPALSGAVSFSSLVSNAGVLGGGFALTSLARDAAKDLATQKGLGPGEVAVVDHTVNLAMSALTFGSYGVASVATEPLSDAAVKVLQEDVPAKAQEVADATLETGKALARDAVTTAREITDRVLEHRRLREGGGATENPV